MEERKTKKGFIMKNSPMTAWMAVCVAGLTTMAAVSVLASQPATAAKPAQNQCPKKNYTGMVTSVDPQEHVVSVKGWWLLPYKRFSLGDTCVYTMLDNNPGMFNDLRPGEKVKVTYQDAHGVLIADRIEQLPMRYEGMVAAIDPARHSLTLHQHFLDTQLQLPSKCVVTLRGDKPGTFADIKPGSHVTVTYETPDGVPTARQIAQTSDLFTGTLTAIDLNSRTVKAQSLLETKKFSLADNCAIVINGKPDGRLTNLRPDEKLDFSFNDVNGVNVVNRIAPAENAASSAQVSGSVAGTTPMTSY